MGIPNDDVVIIRPPESPGEPTIVTISCPDKIGLGCDLCRVILLFGLSIVRGDVSTDGKWCYILFWVVGRGRKTPRWTLLKTRLLAACPPASTPFLIDSTMATEQQSQFFLIKLSCYDRLGLLHDVTDVLYELELTIRRVKVSTTPDGRVMDLFFVTDTSVIGNAENLLPVKNDLSPALVQTKAWELLHTTERRDEVCIQLKECLGDTISCDIEMANAEMAALLQASSSLPFSITENMFTLELPIEPSRMHLPQVNNLSVSMDNSLSPGHTLIQIHCHDHKGLLYDVMRTLKDYNVQISYGRFHAASNGNCEIDLFVVQIDGKKIVDPNKQNALCARLRMELFQPLRVSLVNRGPDMELLVANPVELSGRGRPLVFFDITLALKLLQMRIFVAEIVRHVVGDREWEVYRVNLGDDHELSASRNKIADAVTKMLMGWD